jgi:glycosyltransferase involved in cell wall biosynthesis
VVVSNVSSHPDFAKDGGQLVDIAYHVCEPVSCYYRGYVDLDDLLTKVLRYVEDVEARKQDGAKARAVAMEYNWDDIALKWRKVINDTLAAKPKSKSWMRVTTL